MNLNENMEIEHEKFPEEEDEQQISDSSDEDKDNEIVLSQQELEAKLKEEPNSLEIIIQLLALYKNQDREKLASFRQQCQKICVLPEGF